MILSQRQLDVIITSASCDRTSSAQISKQLFYPNEGSTRSITDSCYESWTCTGSGYFWHSSAQTLEHSSD